VAPVKTYPSHTHPRRNWDEIEGRCKFGEEGEESGIGEGVGPVPKITCKIIIILGARGLYRRALELWNPKPIPQLTFLFIRSNTF
jgi:hypothetical protein